MNSNTELDKSLLEQIYFCMEDQSTPYYLNIETMTVLSAKEFEAEVHNKEVIFPVPEWRSVDGYNLMERFVSSLNNPIARLELNQSLQKEKKVFREFKNTLKSFHEIEQMWFSFRSREMKKRVLDWLNAIRESKGLSLLKDEIDETEELVFSDFAVRVVNNADEIQMIVEEDRIAFNELFTPPDNADYWYSYYRTLHLQNNTTVQAQKTVDTQNSTQVYFGAFTPQNELCAFVWIVIESTAMHRKVARIIQLYVQPEFRGLGIAETLINNCQEYCNEEKIGSIIIENNNPILDNLLTRSGFSECAKIYAKGSIVSTS